MTKKIYIGLWFILGMSACSTVQMPPVDDAYHWPDKVVPSASITPTNPTPQTATTTPKMEFINLQDTTITVRIKK